MKKVLISSHNGAAMGTYQERMTAIIEKLCSVLVLATDGEVPGVVGGIWL
jgi:hypothetical protein